MKNLGQMMKQAQQMQAKMQDMQNQLNDFEVDGQAGAGMVKVTLNGKNELRKVKIDPTLLKPEESEVLEDLLIAAFNDAKNKIETHVQGEMGKLTGGLSLPPGFKLPF